MSKVIIITGASDGIGAAAARVLSANGHQIILVGRSEAKTKAIAAELQAPYYLADFSHLQQVRELAAKLQANHSHIDVLVNNAGGIMGDRKRTEDGFELTFQVNYLAEFLLTTMLLPTLIASKATIIQTASVAAKQFANIDIKDLQNEKHYSPQKAYGDAKLANILFTRELQRRYGNQGITTAAFHPGIVGTGFASDTTHFMKYLYHTPLIKSLFTISPARGAETLVWLIEGVPGSTWRAGGYYEKKRSAQTHPQANDAMLAQQLWDYSIQAIA